MPETDVQDLPVTPEVAPEPAPANEQDGDEGSNKLPDAPSSTREDPLDSLFQKDPALVLAEAKKFRAISQRAKKEDKPEPASQPAPVPTSHTSELKRELARVNTKKATKLATADPEIAENWDAIRELYVNRRGQDDPDDILEDIKEAHALFKLRNPKKDSNPLRDMQRTTVVKTGGTIPPVEGRKTQPLIQKQQSMSNWYKKPE